MGGACGSTAPCHFFKVLSGALRPPHADDDDGSAVLLPDAPVERYAARAVALAERALSELPPGRARAARLREILEHSSARGHGSDALLRLALRGSADGTAMRTLCACAERFGIGVSAAAALIVAEQLRCAALCRFRSASRRL